MPRPFRHFSLLATIGLALFLAGCAGPETSPDTPKYLPVVSDQRGAPFEVTKQVEDNGVRFYLGENIFGSSLIDVLHREVTLKAPKLPRQKTVAVTDIEVSAFVPGTDLLVDRTRTGKYAPAPGSLVLSDLSSDTTTTVRARISYLLDGKPFEEEQLGPARAVDLRVRANELYDQVIDGLISRLARTG